MKAEQFIAPFFPELIWRKSPDNRTVYLTFDDGPTPGVTERVLELLEQYRAKATFFVLGKQVQQAPELFARIQKGGHTVGNHTMTHRNGWKTDLNTYIDDIAQAAEWIPSKLYRPPYGKITPKQIKAVKRHYQIVMWDVLTRDYKPQLNIPKAANRICKSIRPGSILVFHDSKKAENQLFPLLKATLEFCRQSGYAMQALEDKG
jgi:peptidoglycan/xylan/chitin deacetylase (PgdA/CDA1 family)